MGALLGPQFQSSSGSRSKRTTKSVTDAVYDQLTEDYPKDRVDWVHDIKWRGPVDVPLKQVDFDDEKSWRATREQGKVSLFKKRIKASDKTGKTVKPVVLIKRPGDSCLVMDGHHRAEAYQELDRPVRAWVGIPGKAKGPWDTVHDYQFKPGTGPQRDGNKSENIYR